MGSPSIRIGIQANDETNAAMTAVQAKILAFKTQTESSFGSARDSARLFSEEVGVHMPRALSSVMAQSQLLGPLLSTAFPIAAVIGFTEVIVSAADKISKFAADTFIFTDAMKAAQKQLVETNNLVAENAKKIAELKNAYDLIGLTGSQKTGTEALQKTAALEKLQAEERQLRDNLYAAKQYGEVGGKLVAPGDEQYKAWENNLTAVQSSMAKLNQEILNLSKTSLVEWHKESATAAEKHAEALKKLNDTVAKAWFQAVKVEPTAMEANLGINELPIYGRGIQNPLGAGDVGENLAAQKGWFDATRTASEQYAAAVEDLNRVFFNNTASETYQRALKQIQDRYVGVTHYSEEFGRSMGAALEQGVLMGRSWQNILDTILVDFVKLIAQMTIAKDLQASMSAGGTGGFFSSVLGGFLGIGKKASGGFVGANSMSLIGENGPELFVPRTSGTIIPNSALGGITYNIDARGADAGVEYRIRRALKDTEDRAVTRAVKATREVDLRR